MQPLPNFAYLEPGSIVEAVRMLSEAGGRAMVIGGGTDLLPAMRHGIFAPEFVISLQAIGGLRDIRWTAKGGLRIGALATLRAVAGNAAIIRRFPVIAEAAHAVGSPQIRETATVGGNICLDTRCYYYNQSEQWQASEQECLKLGGEICKASPFRLAKKCFAVFSADLAPVLVALDARVALIGAGGEREVALRDFYTGDGATPHVRAADEILTSVTVPRHMAGVFGVYLKYRVRQSIDYPIAGVALTLGLKKKSGAVDNVCLVVGGVATRPVVVAGMAELMGGRPLDEAAIEAAATAARKAALTLPNAAGDHVHRKQMVYELTRRACARAACDAGKARGEGR
jgi:4-hydroxybenzoyl-CoA reductase subunit beta